MRCRCHLWQEFNGFGYRTVFPGGGFWREIFNSDFYGQFPNEATAGNHGLNTIKPFAGRVISADAGMP